MAQRVQIVLEDDLDGGVAAETVTFGLDGVNYEIDLSDKNAGKAPRRVRHVDRPCAPVRRPPHHGSAPCRRFVHHLEPPGPLGRPRVGTGQRPPGQRPGTRLRRRPGGVRQGSLSLGRTPRATIRPDLGDTGRKVGTKRTPRISRGVLFRSAACKFPSFLAFCCKSRGEIADIVEAVQYLGHEQLGQPAARMRPPRPPPRCAAPRRRAPPSPAASRGRSSSWRRCSGSSRQRSSPAAATWSSSTRRGPGASSSSPGRGPGPGRGSSSAECFPGSAAYSCMPLLPLVTGTSSRDPCSSSRGFDPHGDLSALVQARRRSRVEVDDEPVRVQRVVVGRPPATGARAARARRG